jgi:SAM-dependent methyltransferase
MFVTSRSLSKFLSSLDPSFRHRLLNESDPGRVITLMQFQEFLRKRPKLIAKIAVVSGHLSEPELCLITTNAEVKILSFDDNPDKFDLNKDWSLPDWSEYQNTFDLVLCEQVLEHVLHPKRALENLAVILKPGGLLHVTVPAINNSHGEPFYFYAGFPAKTLAEFATLANLTVLECSSWFSDKGARMYSTCNWAPISQSGPLHLMFRGLWASRNSVQALSRILFGRLRMSATYPLQKLMTRPGTKNAVVTWLWAEK